jgi:hypothetical protein
MAGFLRNSADFSFKASRIRVAELSVNAAEFWFSKRFLFSNAFQPNFSEFSENRRDRPSPIFFAPHKFSNPGVAARNCSEMADVDGPALCHVAVVHGLAVKVKKLAGF